MPETYTGETEQTEPMPYQEFRVSSFPIAVEKLQENISNEIYKIPRFTLLDIDGVLFPDIDKLPAIASLRNSQIDEIDQYYMKELYQTCQGKIAIFTDRNPNLNLFISSKYILEKTAEVIPELPIFHTLNKQFPQITQEEKNKLADYIAYGLGDQSAFILTIIEDKTFTIPNRRIFPKYITNQLYKQYGIKCRVENYVIDRNGIMNYEDQNNNSSNPSWNLLYHRLISSK